MSEGDKEDFAGLFPVHAVKFEGTRITDISRRACVLAPRIQRHALHPDRESKCQHCQNQYHRITLEMIHLFSPFFFLSQLIFWNRKVVNVKKPAFRGQPSAIAALHPQAVYWL